MRKADSPHSGKRIGIMGGTFDPVHMGHLIMAEEARAAFALDHVLFIPSGHSYFKDGNGYRVSTPQIRLEMTALAIRKEPFFKISSLETDRSGNTYTCDTLQQLCEEDPDAEYFFIAGADSLCSMHKWYHPEEIFSRCHILAARRSDQIREEEFQEAAQRLRNSFNARIDFLPVRNIEISSSDIRNRVMKGESIHFLVPESVERYIASRELYSGAERQSNTSDDINGQKNLPGREETAALLQKNLPYGRWLHTLGVAETAYALAVCHGADPEKAETAGLLHDCAKYTPPQEMIALCEKYGFAVSDIERQNADLLHAKAGSILAEISYHCSDQEICGAIRWHTTGRPDMTLLEKIIFTADYIEPGRTQAPGLDRIRTLAFQDLDRAVFEILKDTLTYLEKKKKPVDRITAETYAFYKQYLQSGSDSRVERTNEK